MPFDTLFVGSLPYGISLDQVKASFGHYGQVVWAKVCPSNDTEVCAALVQFISHENANWVVENVNGNIPEGLDTPVVVRPSNTGGRQRSKGCLLYTSPSPRDRG